MRFFIPVALYTSAKPVGVSTTGCGVVGAWLITKKAIAGVLQIWEGQESSAGIQIAMLKKLGKIRQMWRIAKTKMYV